MAYLYNAEYLFHPFREHRSIGEMCAFVAEERRATVLTYVVDLYAGDLDAHPTAVALEDSANGVAAANAAGMRSVAVPNRLTRWLDLSHADLVVDSLAELDLARLTALVASARQG